MSDKKDVVKMLKDHSKNSKIIFAADDDREGEAIAWHTATSLKLQLIPKIELFFRNFKKQY